MYSVLCMALCSLVWFKRQAGPATGSGSGGGVDTHRRCWHRAAAGSQHGAVRGQTPGLEVLQGCELRPELRRQGG
jgi:hypothetical protein